MVTGDVIRNEVDRLPVTIGRHHSNRLRLDDPSVSRLHATLEWVAGRVVVTDLGSHNGTYQRGFRIPPSVPLELANEFLFAIGPFVVRGVLDRIEIESTDAPTRAASADELRRFLPDDAAVTVVRRLM
jgi:pSer/pThr/pTyr-binding forkhead associated (FHA) protein